MRPLSKTLFHPKTASLAAIMGIILGAGLMEKTLVFHVLAEVSTVVLGFSVFIAMLSAREHLADTWLPPLACSLLFSSGVDLFHTLSYPEIGVLPVRAGVADQLWLLARLVQCLGALAVCSNRARQARPGALFIFFAAVSVLGTALILRSDLVLPGAHPLLFSGDVQEAGGLLLAGGFLAAAALLGRSGPWTPPSVLPPLQGHAALAALSCLLLTYHSGQYPFVDILRHLASVGAFACAYAATNILAFDHPMACLIHSLRRREEELSARNERLVRQNRAVARLTKHHALTGPDPAEAMRLITQGALSSLGGGRLAVAALDEPGGQLTPLDIHENGQHRSAPALPLASYSGLFSALKGGRYITSDDSGHGDVLNRLALDLFGDAPSSLTAAGIRREGRPVGFILHAAREGRSLDFDGQLFLASLADLAALSLESHDRRLEAAARVESEERLAALVQALPDQVCFKDDRGRWLVANRSWLEAHGIRDGEYQGMTGQGSDLRTDLDGVPTIVRMKTDAAAWVLGRIDFCTLIEGKNGPSAFELMKMALGPAGAPKGLMVLARDVSSQRETLMELVHSHRELEAVTRELTALNETLEQRIEDQTGENRRKDALLMQQSRMAAMGEMIGNIAHQWRQPLNALGLLVSNLSLDAADGTLSEDQAREYEAQCKRILKLMSGTIDDFRNFFKPDKTRQTFSLREPVLEALTLVEASLAQHGIVLEKRLDQDVTVDGFKGELAQVMLNLLANARDALAARVERAAGGGRIMVDVGLSDSMGMIRVSDDGGGVPDELREDLFKPYFTTKPHDKGTGLGLYMSKRIIEDHMGGTISFSNAEGGAVFTVLVPARPASAPKQETGE